MYGVSVIIHCGVIGQSYYDQRVCAWASVVLIGQSWCGWTIKLDSLGVIGQSVT